MVKMQKGQKNNSVLQHAPDELPHTCPARQPCWGPWGSPMLQCRLKGS